MNGADVAWMLVSSALVLLMTPALGFFYGGLVRAKNALNTLMMSVCALGFVGIAWALLSLGDVAFEQGDAARALPWLQEALAVYRGLGDAESTAWALCNLGRVARVQGDGARAEALLLEALTLLRDVRQLWGVAELLIDLEERGLLDTTLVVWLTDFGRTPQINSASGRDHWSSAGFVVMAGAGVPGGAVLGATDDEGGRPTRDEYLSEDIAATIYAKLGIPHDLIAHSSDGRPIRINEGRPIREWM